MKNILYITYDGLTDPLGQSQILPYLQQLSRHGYQFTILSFEKKARFEKEAAVVQEIITAAGMAWVPLFFTARPPIVSKMWDRFRMQQTAEKLHRQKEFAMVHCRSYVSAEIGLMLKQKYGVKMLFDMRGFWADEKVDNGQWNLQRPFYKRLYKHYKQKEKAFLLQADGIISLTTAAKNHLLQQPAYSHLLIDVIPCCADLGHFDYRKIKKEDVTALRQKWNIAEGEKVMTYLGSVGGWYMTAEMFRLFYLLQLQDPAWKMLLLTKDDPTHVRQEAAAVGIPDNKLVITYSDRKHLPAYLALSACSIFFIRNTFSKMASSPTKHAELMGMGIPVICNAIGDTGHIIQNTKTGLLINDFNDETFAAVLPQIATVMDIDKEYIRTCAQNLFDLQAGSAKYLHVYQTVLSSSKVASASVSHV